ncbi:NAD(P)-dependent oxidoreductase [Leifsonia sp. EB34]|uniref:NAD(P)-dependent oxidoreductase n=1 Tax=Leifsonia sp. EB34 TaxID=3156303 RepID=UPI0035130398
MTSERASDDPGAGNLRLTVFGANGGTGRALVEHALAAGHRVTAVTRHPEQFPQRHERLVVFAGDATVPADVGAAIDGADAVLSALGVPYSREPITLYSRSAECIAEAMRRLGVSRLIAVSSAAVDPDGFPAKNLGDRLIGQYLIGPVIHRLGRTMYADMLRMERIVRDSDLGWTILRPPALFDADAAGRTAVSLEPLAHRFVSRRDLGAVMLREVTETEYVGKILYVYSVDGRPSLARTIWEDGIRRKNA